MQNATRDSPPTIIRVFDESGAVIDTRISGRFQRMVKRSKNKTKSRHAVKRDGFSTPKLFESPVRGYGHCGK